MIAKIPWTSRKFNFNLPIGYFPVIFVRLQGTPPRIESLIESFSEKELEQKYDGKWSVKEHIGHLTNLDELHEGRLVDYKNKAAILRPADLTNLKTNQANHNSTPLSKLLSDFYFARNCFLENLEHLDETELSQTAIHPRLQQPMRIVDMAYFVAEHDDHHLATIKEILRVLNPDK